ncbi:MAG: UDP-N-acetylmuramoyl-L-alanyl-D-glutamate--2,6-diaminopimelate ligase [Planctomycetota bacterium]
MDLRDLICGLPIDVVRSVRGLRVSDLTEDSRTVLPGSLFVARPGLSSDGRRYIEQAIARGAAAVLTDATTARDIAGPVGAVLTAGDLRETTALLAERFFGNPSKRLRLAGVTGTNGKTTVAHLAHGLLNAAGQRCGLIGTVTIDDGREAAPAEMTTLPSIELSRTLATMVDHGCTCAVMEVSSHALDQGRVSALSFDAGVFTTLGIDHLDYHGTIESYAAAKAKLFEMLPRSAAAIVNADDPACDRMLSACRARRLRCSASSGDATLDITSRTLSSCDVSLTGPFGALAASLPLAGDYNAMNLLLAVCVAHAFGASGSGLRAGIARPALPRGRLERVSRDADDVTVLIDFAHTPDALESVLQAVRGVAGGSLCVVFGCGGDRDTTKRPTMGGIASSRADRVVLTSDNPRSEDPSGIVREILAGVPAGDRGPVQVVVDRSAAIATAIADADPGDVVIIAGKGHEQTQVSADGVMAFDDREHAARALRRRAEVSSAFQEQTGRA